MKPSRILQSVVWRLSRLPVQIAIVGSLYSGVCAYAYARASGDASFDLKPTGAILVAIGAIMALVVSVSFAYVAFFLNQSNNRKHDLYFRFKLGLFEFDKFLKDYSTSDRLISESEALSWDLKFLKLDDFPLLNWSQRIDAVTPHLTKPDDNSAALRDGKIDPNAVNRILGHLGYLEDVVSEIGMMCIRQIIAGRHIHLVAKALVLLALLLGTLTLTYFPAPAWLLPALYTSPLLFTTAAVMLLIELSDELVRESRETLSFVAWGDDGPPEQSDSPKDGKSRRRSP